MSDAQVKGSFIRDAFRELLSDGQPHRYRDILEYIREKAEGTKYEGTIEQNNMVVDIRPLIGNTDSEYARVQHGIYQKIQPKERFDTVPDMQTGSVFSLLDHCCELQKELQDVIMQYDKQFPDAPKYIATDYQYTERCLDEVLTGISSWIAHTEDMMDEMDNTEAEEQTPTMQM